MNQLLLEPKLKQRPEFCDACGNELTVVCHVGNYKFCRKCSSGSCHTEAIELAKLNHKQKLQLALVKVKSEN